MGFMLLVANGFDDIGIGVVPRARLELATYLVEDGYKSAS